MEEVGPGALFILYLLSHHITQHAVQATFSSSQSLALLYSRHFQTMFVNKQTFKIDDFPYVIDLEYCYTVLPTATPCRCLCHPQEVQNWLLPDTAVAACESVGWNATVRWSGWEYLDIGTRSRGLGLIIKPARIIEE